MQELYNQIQTATNPFEVINPQYSFWYVEDGVEITISADSVDEIEYCIGTNK